MPQKVTFKNGNTVSYTYDATGRKTGTVEQVNHYYPYGGLFGESTGGDAQRYKYNGKEFDRTHGLDWLDYQWYL